MKSTGLHLSSNDLIAQQSMARSTLGILHIAFYQAITSAIAIALLFYTVLQTRRMRKEARITTQAAQRTADAAENAERAMLIAKVVEHCPPGMGHEDCDQRFEREHQIEFDILNIGKSAAIVTKCELGAKPINSMADAEILKTDWSYSDDSWLTSLHLPGQENAQSTYFFVPHDLRPIQRIGRKYFAWCKLSYVDCFGNSWQSTTAFRRLEEGVSTNEEAILFGPLDFFESKIDKNQNG